MIAICMSCPMHFQQMLKKFTFCSVKVSNKIARAGYLAKTTEHIKWYSAKSRVRLE